MKFLFLSVPGKLHADLMPPGSDRAGGPPTRSHAQRQVPAFVPAQ